MHNRFLTSGARTALLSAITLSVFWSAATAQAIAPTLISVGQDARHPTATFSAPRSDHVVIQVATSPARATDGDFLSENNKVFDVLEAPEIQTGAWKDGYQLDPGTYFVLLRASPDFASCYIGPGYDPACADGYSAVMPLTIPVPKARYTTKASIYRFLGFATLTLRAKPLGVNKRFKVCFRNAAKRKRCVNGTLKGYDWNSVAEGDKDIRLRGLAQRTKFTWYVGGKKVASRTIKTG